MTPSEDLIDLQRAASATASGTADAPGTTMVEVVAVRQDEDDVSDGRWHAVDAHWLRVLWPGTEVRMPRSRLLPITPTSRAALGGDLSVADALTAHRRMHR
jgi:hypothetical protein